MARGNAPLVVFNRGRISKLGLARTDLDRTRLSAEVQTNWMPRTLGSMMLRPGLGYLCGIPSNAACRAIPFVFRADDTAILLVADMAMHVVIDDAVLTRASVTSAILNGTFASNLASWTIADETGGTSSWVTGGYLGMTGTRYAKAILRQEVVIGTPSVEHALRIVIARGRVTLRVGSASGGDQYISQTELKTGTHSLAFTPTGNFWVEFQSNTEYQSLVDSVAVESSGTVSIPAPWAEADLGKLRWDQSADVIFVAAEGYQGRRIERRATRSWSVVLYEPDDGPFRSPNTLATRLNPTALTGEVTLQADRPTFDANHVGGLFRVTSIGQQVTGTFTGTDQWTNGIRVSGSTDERQFDVLITSSSGAFNATVRLQKSVGETGSWTNVSGSTYSSSVATTYSDNLSNQVIFYRIGIGSTYSSGTVFGTLTYASGGLTGVGRVTAVAASTSATVSVLTAFGSTAATETWEEGEWSEYRGFPTAVALHDGRLCWAGKSKIFASVSDAYESFDPDTEGDAGPINRSIGSGPVDIIQGLLSLGRLLVFTQGREIQVKTSSLDEPITPTNFNLRDVSTQGSANAAPVKIDKRAMFVQQGGVRLMETGYSGESLDYETADRTLLVPEMGEPSIVRLAVQRQPDTRVHCVRSDGTVALLVSDPAENVVCWIDIETDGDIEDVAVLPGNIEDAVYYVVKRTIDQSGAGGGADGSEGSDSGAGDDTTLLYMRFNGDDGSTTFPDSSPAAHGNATPFGNAQVDTAVVKCGTGSLKLDGDGDYLTYADDPDWSLGDENFTIDAWVRFPSGQVYDLIAPLASAYADASQDSFVKLLMHLDGTAADTTSSDSSPSARGAATFVGTAQLDTAQQAFGTASLLLDGNSDYITYADSADWNLGLESTIDVRVRFASVSGNQVIVAHYNSTGNQRSWVLRFNGGVGSTLEFNYSTDGATTALQVEAAWSPSIDTWYDIKMVRHSGVIWLMVDGIVIGHDDGASGSATFFNSTALLYIGAFNSSGAVTQFFNGWIDELRISNGAARNVQQCVIAHYDAASNQRGWAFIKRLGSRLSFVWTTDGITTDSADITWAPSTDTWYHIAVVRDGATLHLYIDGVEIGTSSDLGTGTIFNGTSTLDIGRIDSTTGFESYFNGWIDNLRINPSAVWTAGFTPPVTEETEDAPSSTVRYLEKWALESEARGGSTNKIADAFGIFNSSDATTLVTGATHLIAATVCAWGSASSGIDLGSTFVVGSTGDFTIGTASTTVIYGLPYTGIYKSAKLAYAAQAGTALTQKKRINHLSVILADAHARGLRYGPSTATLDDLPRTEGMARVSTDAVHETYDRESFEFPGDTDTDARVVLVAQSPRPVTVLGAVIQIETKEKI